MIKGQSKLFWRPESGTVSPQEQTCILFSCKHTQRCSHSSEHPMPGLRAFQFIICAMWMAYASHQTVFSVFLCCSPLSRVQTHANELIMVIFASCSPSFAQEASLLLETCTPPGLYCSSCVKAALASGDTG